MSGEIVVRLLGDRSSLREKLYACRRSDAERDVLLLTKVALLIRDKRLLQEKVTLMYREKRRFCQEEYVDLLPGELEILGPVFLKEKSVNKINTLSL